MARHGRVAFGLCLIPLLGCTRSPAPPDTAADVQAVNQVREREIAAFSAGQPDTLASLFTSDAVIMPPNEPVLNGSAALRTWAQAIADQATVRGQYTSSDVVVVGDWAIDRYTGLLTITPKGGGAANEERVKGIHIFRRQPDGSWRIVQDVWNTDSPPPVTR